MPHSVMWKAEEANKILHPFEGQSGKFTPNHMEIKSSQEGDQFQIGSESSQYGGGSRMGRVH